jgi:ElaA protein
MPHIRVSPLAQVDALTLYRLLRLRVDVFVVEQECAYPELDGRDEEPGALLLWIEDGDDVVATARLLDEGDRLRIGRVATARPARGRGLAARIVRHAIGMCGGRAVAIDAQAHLAGWYGRFGFAVSGPGFVEDGIPHVPMLRPADGGSAADQAQAS